MKLVAWLAAPLLPLTLSACGGGGDTSATTASGTGGATSSTSSRTFPTASTTASGGQGGGGAACSSHDPVTTSFVPTAADIQFHAVSPVPQGESILFNEWATSPNHVTALSVDGVTATRIFEAYRVWSMGASRTSGAIAFACGDPDQEKHYGLTLGDAIQHTWLYDVAAETATLLADGNLSDECHAFGPGDATLYVCRRANYSLCDDYDPYRVAAIDLATKAATYLTPADSPNMALHPQPLPDGKSLLFEQITVTPQAIQHDIESLPLPPGAPTTLRQAATNPMISPDGARYVFLDTNDQNQLWVSNLDGTQPVRISRHHGTSITWSPDGARVAFLYYDPMDGCSSIEIVAADGSTVDAPLRVRDCATTGEFITQIAWIART